MTRTFTFVILLALAACTEPDPTKRLPGAPDYARLVEGDNYNGVLFQDSPVIVPGLEEEGALNLMHYTDLPRTLRFRQASKAEVAAFEVHLSERWSTSLCSADHCPFRDNSYLHLAEWYRQYVGYDGPGCEAGLWVNFSPKGQELPPLDGEGPDYSYLVLLPGVVYDGGPMHFRVRYCMSRDSVEAVAFNGV
ncbi:MAG: hypothetical protein ACR2GR_12800 [Rhodothermales bacterium]